METPELDDAINVLKILKSRGDGELTERGERRLLEYETIKKQLALFNVSQQRELLIGFEEWYGVNSKRQSSKPFELVVDEYLKTINCG